MLFRLLDKINQFSNNLLALTIRIMMSIRVLIQIILSFNSFHISINLDSFKINSFLLVHIRINLLIISLRDMNISHTINFRDSQTQTLRLILKDLKIRSRLCQRRRYRCRLRHHQIRQISRVEINTKISEKIIKIIRITAHHEIKMITDQRQQHII